MNVANIDSDNDGVLDDLDMCPVGYGTDTYWYSTEYTDFDGDVMVVTMSKRIMTMIMMEF